MDEALNDFIGTSGTLVGAALESVGYYYQSYMLDAFLPLFEGSLGALVYIVGAMVALITFVVAGRYKFGLWFFLGPGLFFAVVVPRQATSGSDWWYGDERRNTEELQRSVQASLGVDLKLNPDDEANAYKPRVSSLFAWYNNLVSSTTREIVKTLDGTREKTDIKFILRAQLYNQMISPVLTQPGFRELIHYSLNGRCRRLLEAGRQMNDPINQGGNPSKAANWALTYARLARDSQIPLTRAAAEYLAMLRVDYPELFNMQLVNTAETEIQNFNSRCHLINGGASCIKPSTTRPQFVNYAEQQDQQKRSILEGFGLGHARQVGKTVPDRNDLLDMQELQRYIDRLAAEAGQATDEEGVGTATNTTQEISRPYDEYIDQFENRGYTCHEIWNFVYAALHRYTKNVADVGIRAMEDAGLTKEQAEDEFVPLMLGGYSEFEGVEGMYNYIAKRVFRNEMLSGSTSAFISRYAKSGGDVYELGTSQLGGLSLTERARTKNREWRERTRMMASAAALPYYQGLALYFLGVTFPFFAMLLLVPGKHAGFLIWFAGWFWVKSWDIGYAIVMLLDNVLFQLFVENSNASTGTQELNWDLGVAIYSLQEMDPTFDLSTYYSIVAVALQSIPIVTSYIVLGSVRGGAGLIAAGMERWAGAEFGAIGDGGALGAAAQMGASQHMIDSHRGLATF